MEKASKKLMMGNEAIGLAALRAGVKVVTGYPGTPSTEILETVASAADDSVHVEWSVNEKSALEVAAGAAYAGARTLVTMKQVGLNVASDPLMSLAYVGVKGGMVVAVADDPGPISSQTEQDTRTFAAYSKLPVFDPCCPEEAYEMISDAYELSEKYSTPVLFRPTTRICHACAAIEQLPALDTAEPEGFCKDPKWVIFPRLAYNAHLRIEERNDALRDELSDYRFNGISGAGRLGIAAGGVSYAYASETLSLIGGTDKCRLLKVATPFPFPERLALDFLRGLDEVMVYEELDSVIERELILICGKYGLKTKIRGKLSGDVPRAGENGVEAACKIFSGFLGIAYKEQPPITPGAALPVRPPVLCAGCPHRASFYAVKRAMKGKKAVFCGDIGCYTLGNAHPLDMTDTCLCMGAGITVAQGIGAVEMDTVCFSFTGDSTFFHTGLAGIANAVYNRAHMVAVILDNSTTAMTGRQPTPANGLNVRGGKAPAIDIEGVIRALGVQTVITADPLDFKTAVSAVRTAAAADGVSAIIFRSPCIALGGKRRTMSVDTGKCTGCTRCIRELGCPAIVCDGEKVRIDAGLCNGCGLCAEVCPSSAIGGVENV